MTYYYQQINLIKTECYSNARQLETVIAARNFIDKNYAKTLNLDLLASRSFSSKFHLLRIFQKYYGQTPKQYSTAVKIAKAKTLLSSGTSVTAACYHSGFQDCCAFSRLFRSRTGVSPMAYKKEQDLQSKFQ